MDPRIRPATRADLPRLAAFLRALAADQGDTATVTEARLARLFFGAHRASAAWIAEQDGRALGFAATVPQVRLASGERGTEVAQLYVVPEARGRGIGRALLAAAEAAAEAEGHAWLAIGAQAGNRAAQGAWRAMGLDDLPPPGPRFAKRLGARMVPG